MSEANIVRPKIVRNGVRINAENEAKEYLRQKYREIARKGYIVDEYLSLKDDFSMRENLFCGDLLSTNCCAKSEYLRCIGMANHFGDHISVCNSCGYVVNTPISEIDVCKKIIGAILTHSDNYYNFTASQITTLSTEPKSKVRFHIKKYEERGFIEIDKDQPIDMRKRFFCVNKKIDDWAYRSLIEGFNNRKMSEMMLRSHIPIKKRIHVIQSHDSMVKKILQGVMV